MLDADGQIVMAHPFSAVPLGFAVMGSATLWSGGCAWDSFALPHVVSAELSDVHVLRETTDTLAVPLTGLDGREFGVITLVDKRRGAFSELDEAVLVQLAQMASAAVERTRLYLRTAS